MAARGDRKDLTEFVNRRILETINLVPEDKLLDIGGGDGSLLNMAAQTTKGTGVTASEDERKKLCLLFPELTFIAARVQGLPISAKTFSKIVCNATLFYLPAESDVRVALSEIARVAQLGATIWIGEIPEIDEYAHYKMYRGTSMLAFLWHLLKNNGFRAFLGMIRRWIRATFGQEQIILNSAGLFYAPPQKMILMAEEAGLRLQTYFRHRDINDAGLIRDCEFRYDYLFSV